MFHLWLDNLVEINFEYGTYITKYTNIVLWGCVVPPQRVVNRWYNL